MRKEKEFQTLETLQAQGFPVNVKDDKVVITLSLEKLVDAEKEKNYLSASFVPFRKFSQNGKIYAVTGGVYYYGADPSAQSREVSSLLNELAKAGISIPELLESLKKGEKA